MREFTFIDLFAGCGGLSEGFLETGHYKSLAHIEWELPMVTTLRNRLSQKWNLESDEAKRRVIRFDIQKTAELFTGNWSEESAKLYSSTNHQDILKYGLDGLIGKEKVDLIIGGPPCQAYSLVGRAQDPYSMKNDYRNYLFESFVKIVDHFKPSIFVFENVPGLLSACPGNIPIKNRIYEAFKQIGYEILQPQNLKNAIFCSVNFNTPQIRNRLIIFGVSANSKFKLDDLYSSLHNRQNDNKSTVRDAIGFLPKLYPLKEPTKNANIRISHTQTEGLHVSQHDARYHNLRDIKVFKEWLSKGLNSAPTQHKLNYYKKITGKSSNHIKYRALEWDKPSPTVVSHLYKDGLMFIHPDEKQLRSITVREAALLQSFPIDFEFIGSKAACFKMIGNAVPVSFAKQIALAIYDVMRK